MMRVGLTGGLATGKTTVAQILSGLGCFVIQADKLGHQVLGPGGEAYDKAVARFGESILRPDRTINRRALANIVFSDPAALEELNSFVHPAVYRLEEQIMRDAEASDSSAIVIVEAAILIETGSYTRFDRLILTVCSTEQQIERAVARDGLTREEVIDRLSRQMPLQKKREYAHYVIDTSGDMAETERQTHKVYAALRSLKV